MNQPFAADGDWRQDDRLKRTSIANESMPKRRASSECDGGILTLPCVHFALLDTLSLPPLSCCSTFAHLLANESFTCRWNVIHAEQRRRVGRITNLLIFYNQQEKKEGTKHHISWLSILLDTFAILRNDISPRGREGEGPRTSQRVSCGQGDVFSPPWACDVCEMSIDVSLWFISYGKLWSQVHTWTYTSTGRHGDLSSGGQRQL